MPAPFFMVDNPLRGATVIAEDTITGFEFNNALDGSTSTQAGFLTGAARSVTFDLGVSTQLRFFGAAAHNMTGARVQIETSPNGSSFTVARTVYFSAGVTVSEFAALSTRYLRITIDTFAVDGYVSDLFIGDAVELPYGMPVGFIPPEFADEDEINTNMTGNGAIVGIELNQRPKKIQVKLDDYEASWMASNWPILRDGLKQYPGYFLWSDTGQPFYGSFDGGADKPKYTSHNRMSGKVNMIGFTE